MSSPSSGGLVQASKKNALPSAVLAILQDKVCIKGHEVRLREQIDPQLYSVVDEVFERLGGQYRPGAKKHEFPFDPTPLIAFVCESRTMPPKNELDFFPSPPEIAAEIQWRLDPEQNWNMRFLLFLQQEDGRPFRILEPSAGMGHLAEMLRDLFPTAHIHCCELDAYRRAVLRAKGFTVVEEGDFLRYSTDVLYDVVVMNSPFSVGTELDTYIRHISHALELLHDADTSELYALAPLGFTFNTQRVFSEFLTFVLEHGSIDRLPEGAFRESGTMVPTVLLQLSKQVSPVFRNTDEPLWGYPNRRMAWFLESVKNEDEYSSRFSTLLDAMVSGELPMNTNSRPVPATRDAIVRFIQETVAHARRHLLHLPLLSSDLDLIVAAVLKQFEREYDWRLEGLRRRQKAQKAERLGQAQRARDDNRAVIERDRARIRELEERIALREREEPRLVATYEAIQAELQADLDLNPPACSEPTEEPAVCPKSGPELGILTSNKEE